MHWSLETVTFLAEKARLPNDLKDKLGGILGGQALVFLFVLLLIAISSI